MARIVGAVAALLVALVVGAGLLRADDPPPLDPASATVKAVDPFLREHVLLTLGPWPEGHDRDPIALERLRIGAANERWAQLKLAWSDAERPDYEFAGYLEPDALYEAIHECLVEAGVRSEFSHSGGIRWEIGTQEDAVAIYVCSTKYEREPVTRLSDAQVAYLYDYAVQFEARCLEGLGIAVPPPPPKTEFVAEWPSPGWNARAALAVTSQAFAEHVREVCPPLTP